MRALHMKGPQNWGHSGLGCQAHCSFHQSQLEQAACNAPGSQDSWALSTDDSPPPSVWDCYLGLFIREAEIMLQAEKGVDTPTTYASNFRLRYEVRQKGSFIRWSTVRVQFRCPGSSDREVSFSHGQSKETKLPILALNSLLKKRLWTPPCSPDQKKTLGILNHYCKNHLDLEMQCKKCQLWICNRGLLLYGFTTGTANPRGQPSLDNVPSSKQGVVCRNLAFLKQNVKAPLEKEREASTEGNTW